MDRRAADPRLNAEPAAGNDGAQNRRKIGAAHAKRRANEDRKRNAVLRAGMRVEQHRNEHDEIAQQHRADGLLPVHALGDERRGKLVGGDLHRHGEPQRDVVVGRPGALRGRGRREVAIGEGRVDGAQTRLRWYWYTGRPMRRR